MKAVAPKPNGEVRLPLLPRPLSLAKEGRKYGVFLGLVTQRPAELDPTILSQCSTLFAMRMTNERDQSLLRSAVADTAANLLAFLPSLGTGEALAFGEGVALPTRLKFKQLPDNLLPKSETVNLGEVAATSGKSPHSLASVIERWRGRIGEQPSLQEQVPRRHPWRSRQSSRGSRRQRSIRTASGCSNGHWISRC